VTELDAAAIAFAHSSVLASLPLDPNRDVEDLKMERKAATAMLASLHPTDAVQAALAARAVAMHHAAMECMRRTTHPEASSAQVAKLFVTAMALSRMSIQLMKALAQRQTEDSRAHRAAPAKPAATGMAAGAGGAAAGAQARPPAPEQRPAVPNKPAAAAAPGAAAKEPMHQTSTAIDPAIIAGLAAMAALPNGLTPEEISVMTAMAAELAAIA
jgi:hypothetical protein